MKYKNILISIAFLVLTAAPGQNFLHAGKSEFRSFGNQYYLSPAGDDAYPGTKDKPWKTISKANQSLQPGDIVTFLNGKYSGIINPANSGSGGDAPIIYRAENLHKSILTGQNGSNYIINLRNKSYIEIDGFCLSPEKNGFGNVEDCNHINIENCRMEGSSRVYCPLEFKNCDNIRFLSNDICRVISRTEDSKIHGDGCHFIDCASCIIEDNTFHKIGHSPLRIWSTGKIKPLNFIIRGNCFYNGWGRSFEFFNLERSLIEDNIITEAYNGATSADAQGKVFMNDGIFRFNKIYENGDYSIGTMSYTEIFDKAGTPLFLQNTRIYNNTFSDNPLPAWEMGTYNKNETPIRMNVFKNNIFSNNGFMTGYNNIIIHRQGCADDNILIGNIFPGQKTLQPVITLFDEKLTIKEGGLKFPSQFINNLEINMEKEDSPLSGGNNSVAGPGQPLTSAKGGGSGKVITVADARYFFDGFGIEGEQGDLISIGNKKTLVRILKADFIANVLTLDREVTWKNNDPVTIPYSGATPDIGAYRSTGDGRLKVIPVAWPVSPETDQPVKFSSVISDSKGESKILWIFRDSTVLNKPEFTHSFAEPGEYPVRVKCYDHSGASSTGIILVKVRKKIDPNIPLVSSDFEEKSFEEWGSQWDHGPSRKGNTYRPEQGSDGKGQCMSVTAANGNNMLAVNIKVRYWNIDQYPMISFRYRIPKGVPVGVWLAPWPSREKPQRICMGGSPANSSASMPGLDLCRLTDDGEWHNTEIDARGVQKIVPDLKIVYAFEFYTYGNSSEDQKFWFDDFEIKPIYK